MERNRRIWHIDKYGMNFFRLLFLSQFVFASLSITPTVPNAFSGVATDGPFGRQAIIPPVVYAHMAILSGQNKIVSFLVGALLVLNNLSAQNLGRPLNHAAPTPINNSFNSVEINADLKKYPADSDRFLHNLDLWLNYSPTLLNQVKPTQSDLDAYRVFVQTVRKELILSNAADSPLAGVHFRRSGSMANVKIFLNASRIQALFEKVPSDPTAGAILVNVGLKLGHLLQEQGGFSFLKFIEKEKYRLARQAPARLPALNALKDAIDKFGVILFVDPDFSHVSSVDIDPPEPESDMKRLSLKIFYDWELFRNSVFVSRNPNAPDMFLSSISKEGGGILDIVERPRVYSDLYKRSEEINERFGNISFHDVKNAEKIGAAIRDRRFMRKVYEQAGTLMYVEYKGYAEVLSLWDAIGFNLQKFDSVVSRQPVFEGFGNLRLLMAAVEGGKLSERSILARRHAMWHDVMFSFPAFQLIVQELAEHRLIIPQPGGTRLNLTPEIMKQTDFILTDPTLTHENDRPGFSPQAHYSAPFGSHEIQMHRAA